VRKAADAVFAARGKKVGYLVGTMIEIPRAALTADKIAETAEFFSFGTNDLTQMTYGLSRDDVTRTLGRQPDFEVVSDGILVLEANNRGEPFMSLNPKARISGDVESIARTLVRSMQEEHRAAADKAAREAMAREQASAGEA